MSKKIGLALSSGGWRGLAHIGVIKSLLNANIKIDYIVGCSAGALIGGLYSATGDIDKVESFVHSLGYKDMINTLSDPSPSTGLLKGNKYEKLLNDFAGNKSIQGCHIPFTAIATDIFSGQTVYLKDGNLAQAIRASSSIPLIFKPVSYHDQKLIDGAASVVVPVENAKANADIVIAVNLYGQIFPIDKFNGPPKYLKRFRKNKRLSGLSVTRLGSFSLLHHLAKLNCSSANITICPPINKNDFSFFKGVVNNKDSIAIGQTETDKYIPRIKKLLKPFSLF